MWAANEGKTVIDKFPKERPTDFETLADRVLGTPTVVPAARRASWNGARTRQPARA